MAASFSGISFATICFITPLETQFYPQKGCSDWRELFQAASDYGKPQQNAFKGKLVLSVFF